MAVVFQVYKIIILLLIIFIEFSFFLFSMIADKREREIYYVVIESIFTRIK